MANETKIPAPPPHLSAKAAKQWTKLYTDALAQAKISSPDNERAQRMSALKAANALLAVPAPASAADVDKLDEWQKLLDETRLIKGVHTRVCVTSDGRKYAFAIEPASNKDPDLKAMNKGTIVAHALEVHDLELDPKLTKDELIAAVAAKAAA